MTMPGRSDGRTTVRAVVALTRLLLVLGGTSLALCACGPRGGMSDRYVAEKLAWQAQKLHRAMATNPELATDEMRARLRDSYAEIVRLFPPPSGDAESLTEIEADVARISGMSRMRLAAIVQGEGDGAESRRLYASVVDSYAFERGMAIEASVSLAAAYEAADMQALAADVLSTMVGKWPPATSRDAPPDPRVLRAPLLAATSRVAAGTQDPGEAIREARDYYDRTESEWAGTPTGAAALGTLAETYELEGRWADAISSYERLDREYGREETRAPLWLKLADLHAGAMNDTERATEYYRAVEGAHGDDTDGATASVSLARFDIADRRYEEARERLESVLTRFQNEETLAATAAHYIALSFEFEGRSDNAISRYGELSSSYPTTSYGLAAPLHVAELYAVMDEEEASATALSRAADHYGRIMRDYADTPAATAASNYLVTTRIAQEEWSEVASLLLDIAARHPGSAASSAAMLRAAEVFETKLSDRDRARNVLMTVMSTYEGTPAATEAAARLDRMAER